MPLLAQMPAQLALAVRSSLERGESVLFTTLLGSRRALVLTSRRVLVAHRGWRGAHVKAIPYAQVDYVLDRRHSLELFANRAATRLVLPVPAEHFDHVRELLRAHVKRVTEPTSWIYRMVDAFRDSRH